MTRAAAARLLALVSAAFICAHAAGDPDLWGHVRFGLDTLRDRRLASIDPYSFTQDVPWVNHEWLSEVAQAVAYRAAGVFGLIALKTILLGAAVALLALGTRRVLEPYRWLLLAAGIVSLAPAAYTMRPQLWTLLGIPALWWALQQTPAPCLHSRDLRVVGESARRVDRWHGRRVAVARGPIRRWPRGPLRSAAARNRR